MTDMPTESFVARRLPAAERRRRLEHAAVGLFAERGFAATTVEDIVAAAGVSKPVFYRHYESKHELVLLLLKRHRDGLAMAPIGALIQSAELPLQDRIALMLVAWFGYLDAHPIALELLHSRTGDAEIDAAIEELHERQRAADANLLREFAATTIPEQELSAVAETIRASLSGLAIWSAARPEIPRSAVIAALTRLVLGLLSEPAP